jgi:signal peptidase complex subunit 3
VGLNNFNCSFEHANLTLAWDVTPYVGVLQSGQSKQGPGFILPSFSGQK